MGVATSAERGRVDPLPRIAGGHLLTRLALVVRRLSLPVALVAVLLVVAWGSAPSSFTLGLLGTAAIPAGILLACRAVAMGLAMAGWLVFPPDHRTVLVELTDRAESRGVPSGR